MSHQQHDGPHRERITLSPEDLSTGFAALMADMARQSPQQTELLRAKAEQADLGHEAHALGREYRQRGEFAQAARWLRTAARYHVPGAQQDLDSLPARGVPQAGKARFGAAQGCGANRWDVCPPVETGALHQAQHLDAAAALPAWDTAASSAAVRGALARAAARRDAERTITAAREEAANLVAAARLDAERTITAAREEAANLVAAARLDAERTITAAVDREQLSGGILPPAERSCGQGPALTATWSVGGWAEIGDLPALTGDRGASHAMHMVVQWPRDSQRRAVQQQWREVIRLDLGSESTRWVHPEEYYLGTMHSPCVSVVLDHFLGTWSDERRASPPVWNGAEIAAAYPADDQCESWGGRRAPHSSPVGGTRTTQAEGDLWVLREQDVYRKLHTWLTATYVRPCPDTSLAFTIAFGPYERLLAQHRPEGPADAPSLPADHRSTPAASTRDERPTAQEDSHHQSLA
ncbi:hypothetical protein [Streptomyces sp. NPDC001380]|uniref:hypothetical protein n=1 Tax=Streptomyces sp. NPDC001380 TaxID=3364566 RepID=UPI0036C09864